MNPKAEPFPRLWAIHPPALSDALARWQVEHEATAPAPKKSGAADDDSPRARALAALQSAAGAKGAVAVLPIQGGLRKRGSYWGLGMEDYERVLLEVAARTDVKAIVLAVDSPGGTVDGIRRLADVVALVNAAKPVVAFADGMCCSAAYWLAAQTSAIVAAPFALVGSIGVLLVHADFSAYLEKEGIKVTILRSEQSTRKAEGNPFEPLSADVKAALTAELTAIADVFIATVRAGRASLEDPAAWSGAAWTAEQAPAGLVDQIGPLERAIQLAAELADKRARARVSGTPAQRAAAGAPSTRPAANGSTSVPVTADQPQENSDMSLFAFIKSAFGGDKKKTARALELASEDPAIAHDALRQKVDTEFAPAPGAAPAADPEAARLAAIRAKFAADPAALKRAFAVLADHPEFGAEQIAAALAQEDAAELARLREENARLTKAAADEKTRAEQEKTRADQLAASGLARPVATGPASAGLTAGGKPAAAPGKELTGLNRVTAAFASDPRNPAVNGAGRN